METVKKWYAVYTKPRWEKKVAELLTKRKIENFCPLNKVVRQWADRKKTVLEPLFTSYVFVCVTEAEQLSVKQTEGILTFVYWLGSPAVIRHEEILAIQDFLHKHTNVHLEQTEVKVHDRVRITDGLLVHREGEVKEVKGKTIKVSLPSLGYMMIAEVSKAAVEIVGPLQTDYASAV